MSLHAGLCLNDQLLSISLYDDQAARFVFHERMAAWPGHLAAALKQPKYRALRQATCTLTLANASCPLTLIDIPQAEDDEQTRNLILFHGQELLQLTDKDLSLDFTRLPDKAWRGQRQQGFVVAEQRLRLEQLWFDSHGMGLNLQQIECVELSLGRLGLSQQNSQQQALLIELKNRLLLLLYYQQQLCLVRHIDFQFAGQKSLANQFQLDNLTLQLQRSFDFYEHHMALGQISHLALLTTEPFSERNLEHLMAELPQRTQTINLDPILSPDPEPVLDQFTLASMGAALRGVST